jgi:signal transduction histidine kinase
MPGLLWLRERFRREVVLALAGVLVLVLLIIGFVTFGIVQTYHDAVGIGRVRSANLALVLEEQTRRTVQAIDLSLATLVDTLRNAPDTPGHDPAFTARLRARLADLPYVRALFVIGADGFLIQDSDPDTPNVGLADRDYFRVHIDDPDVGLYIGEPLRSRSLGAPWFVSVSRRITLRDGRFYGVAVAALEPKYFAQFYADIKVGDAGAVALAHRSGMLIARYPDHQRGMGLSLADGQLFARHLPRAGTGTFIEHSKVDGVERVFSYRLVAPWPLVVTVGISKATLLADWWNKAVLAGGAALAVVTTMLAGTLIILRRRHDELLAAERLQQIEQTEALGHMTGAVAHDFNNLLTIIGGNLELIARHLHDSQAQRRAAAAVEAVRRGGRMVSQLLAFARREPMVAASESPAELVAALSELLRHAARPCAVEIEAGPDIWKCEIDTSQFERAVMNLVVNARDASQPGARIAVRVFNVPLRDLDRTAWPELAACDHVACEVSDQGQGMPPEVQRRAFEPLFTTKPPGRGTGLGLSQVFGFARQSGGGVHIRSAPGSGTMVTLMLPRAVHVGAEDRNVSLAPVSDQSRITHPLAPREGKDETVQAPPLQTGFPAADSAGSGNTPSMS